MANQVNFKNPVKHILRLIWMCWMQGECEIDCPVQLEVITKLQGVDDNNWHRPKSIHGPCWSKLLSPARTYGKCVCHHYISNLHLMWCERGVCDWVEIINTQPLKRSDMSKDPLSDKQYLLCKIVSYLFNLKKKNCIWEPLCCTVLTMSLPRSVFLRPPSLASKQTLDCLSECWTGPEK